MSDIWWRISNPPKASLPFLVVGALGVLVLLLNFIPFWFFLDSVEQTAVAPDTELWRRPQFWHSFFGVVVARPFFEVWKNRSFFSFIFAIFLTGIFFVFVSPPFVNFEEGILNAAVALITNYFVFLLAFACVFFGCFLIRWWREKIILATLFGQVLPVLVAVASFVFLVLHLEPSKWQLMQEWPFLDVGFLEKEKAPVLNNLILLLGGSIGWYFFCRRAAIAAQNAQAVEQGVTVERLTRAVDQLASKDASIRMGGILGLEQIAESQEEELEKICLILSTRIRELATIGDTAPPLNRSERLDVEIAVKSLARIASKFTSQRRPEVKFALCALAGVNFRNLSFYEIDFSSFNLMDADFSGAWLIRANFTGAFLVQANLSEANISGANFDGAGHLTQTQLDEAFYEKGNPPINLPPGLKPPPVKEKPPPEREKPE